MNILKKNRFIFRLYQNKYSFYLKTGPIKKQWDNMTTKRPSGVNLCLTGQNPPSRNVLELRILLWSWQKIEPSEFQRIYFQNQSIYYICWYVQTALGILKPGYRDRKQIYFLNFLIQIATFNFSILLKPVETTICKFLVWN